MSTTPRPIPLNLYGVPFGLLGLADCWLVAATFGLAPVAIGRLLVAVAVIGWVVVASAHLRGMRARGIALGDELGDPIAGPFASLAVITPMLAAADAVYPLSHTTGTVIVDVLIVATVVLAGWFTGQWIYRPLELAKVHPGYFLPSVAGGFVASASAGLVGQLGLAQMLFGLGLVSWIVLGSIVLGRLVLGPQLPTPLIPTIAIEVAPAAVATFAAFVIDGHRVDTLVRVLAGYGLLMVVAQLRLLPAYLRLSFMPSFWAFTFSWAAVTFAGMTWLGVTRPPGWNAESYLALALISAFIGAIAIRTVAALQRGQLLPSPVATTPRPCPTPALSDRSRALDVHESRPDYTTKESPWPVAETTERLTGLITERGTTVFATIDQRAAARRAGLELRENVLIIFGNPRAGTPVMAAEPLAALDLPLKLIVWDDHGRTRVSYLTPDVLAARHGLSDSLAAPLVGIDQLTEAALTGAARAASHSASSSTYRTIDLDGSEIFYREAGDRSAPPLLLLHGFPGSSAQYERLMDPLRRHAHTIAPDLPGFGRTPAPPGTMTFDRLADAIEQFTEAIGFDRYSLYVFDFGAPIGFRLAIRHPERIAALVIQNGNAYEAGLGPRVQPLRAYWSDRAAHEDVREALRPESTRTQYLEGTPDPSSVNPDLWEFDQHYLDQDGHDRVMLDLLYDYQSNVASYPAWHEYMRTFRLPALIAWGTGDRHFPPAGTRAYLNDLPDAELHLFETGHFATATHSDEIAELIAEFLPRHCAAQSVHEYRAPILSGES